MISSMLTNHHYRSRRPLLHYYHYAQQQQATTYAIHQPSCILSRTLNDDNVSTADDMIMHIVRLGEHALQSRDQKASNIL